MSCGADWIICVRAKSWTMGAGQDCSFEFFSSRQADVLTADDSLCEW